MAAGRARGAGMGEGSDVRALLLLLAFSTPCSAQRVVHPVGVPISSLSDTLPHPTGKQHDSLFGLDKPKHFLLSAFIESVTFSSLQAAGSDYRSNIAAGAGIAGLLGVGKELHDRRTTGLFSFGDLVWDAAGAATAAVLLRHTYR